jgi:hypothetical protein
MTYKLRSILVVTFLLRGQVVCALSQKDNLKLVPSKWSIAFGTFHASVYGPPSRLSRVYQYFPHAIAFSAVQHYRRKLLQTPLFLVRIDRHAQKMCLWTEVVFPGRTHVVGDLTAT